MSYERIYTGHSRAVLEGQILECKQRIQFLEEQISRFGDFPGNEKFVAELNLKNCKKRLNLLEDELASQQKK